MATKFRNVLTLALLFLGFSGAFASSVTNISGSYYVTEYLRTGQPLPGRDLKVYFTILLSDQRWQIVATNASDPKVWEVLMFDGVDTFELMPYEGHLVAQRNCDLFGSVNHGNCYRLPATSYVAIYYPWLTFVFRPATGRDAMPLPWAPASWISAYGYRWHVNYSEGNRFIDNLTITRDRSLDLDDKGEFARLTVYPKTGKEFSDQLTGLSLRNNIPGGFTNSTLNVKEWAVHSGVKVPDSVEVLRYKWLNGSSELAFGAKISVDAVTVSSGEIGVPGLTRPAYVRDVRYAIKRDGRFFPYAEYTNSETWKTAADPSLLAQADAFLKNGPRTDDYGLGVLLEVKSGTRRHIIWLILILLQLAGACVIFRIVKSNKNKQNTKQNK